MTLVGEEKLLRRWVEQQRPFGRGRTYSEALRRRIVAFLDAAKAAGKSEVECCKVLGVSPTSVSAWRRAGLGEVCDVPFGDPDEAPAQPATKALVPVEVTPSPVQLGGGLSLVTPGGFRVEGLSLEQAFALLREFE